MCSKKRIVSALILLGLAGCVGVVLYHRNELAEWYHFTRTFESLGANEQGRREFRHRESGIVFARIPAGSFLMGSPEDEPGSRDWERPVHEVRLSAFLIAKHELGQRDWTKVMGENLFTFVGADLPAENVSWHDSQEFCRRLGFSLPTEAQWERACRGDTKSPFSFGNEANRQQVQFWDGATFRTPTVPVGSLPPNPFGLHEVHGNVSEWCEDIYDEDFYKRPEAQERDPVCTEGTGHRVVRGGDASLPSYQCRAASRSWAEPSNRSFTIGLRPVWNYLSPKR